MPFYFGRDSNYECDLKVEQSELLKRTAVFEHFYAFRNLENKV